MGILQGDSVDHTGPAMYWQYGTSSSSSSSHLSSSAALPDASSSQVMDSSSAAFEGGSVQPQGSDPAIKEESKDTSGIQCAGCDSKICDRYYLVAVDKAWHSGCLRCCECRCTFDTALSCFAKQSRIYCKNDYYRLFGTKHCAKCELVLEPHELVMRARDSFYHTRCFCCHVCSVHLTKGSTFGMLDTRIFCKDHYQMAVSDPDLNLEPSNPVLDHQIPHHENPYEYPFLCHNGFPNPTFPMGFDPLIGEKLYGPPASVPVPPGVYKTKNRKRKNKDALHQEALGLGPADPMEVANGGAPVKTKRMRTSFKHHQLRMLKSYFATNHNPDAKDLKQLSQKTSLSKRVLQVWFQNARAKWRRLTQKQDGTNNNLNNEMDGSPNYNFSSITIEDTLLSTSRNSMSVYEDLSLSGSSSVASIGFPSPL